MNYLSRINFWRRQRITAVTPETVEVLRAREHLIDPYVQARAWNR